MHRSKVEKFDEASLSISSTSPSHVERFLQSPIRKDAEEKLVAIMTFKLFSRVRSLHVRVQSLPVKACSLTWTGMPHMLKVRLRHWMVRKPSFEPIERFSHHGCPILNAFKSVTSTG